MAQRGIIVCRYLYAHPLLTQVRRDLKFRSAVITGQMLGQMGHQTMGAAPGSQEYTALVRREI